MGYKQKYTAVGQMKGKAAGLVHKSSAIGMQLDPTDPKSGKKLKKEDIESIKQSTDITFTEEGANQLFERDPKGGAPVPDADLGKYAGMGYFERGPNIDGIPTYTITEKVPGGRSRIKDFEKNLKKLNPRGIKILPR